MSKARDGFAVAESAAPEELVGQTFELLSVIENLPDLVVILDDGGTVLFANAWASNMLGAGSPERLLGVPFKTLVDPSQSATFDAISAGRFEALPIPTEVRLRKFTGDFAVGQLSQVQSVKLFGKSATLLVCRDVTSERVLERRLQLSERLAAIGTLAAGVAHEINNPLAFVSSNLEYINHELQRVAAKDPEASELIAAIGDASQGAQRIAVIVRDLKLFSRDQEQSEPVDLKSAVEWALKIVDVQLRHRCEVRRDLQPTPKVVGSEGRFGQLFANILLNAVQALPEGRPLSESWIRVATTTDAAGNAVVEIQDTGCGIPEAQLGRIFDPFFTTKPVGKGTGLGLTIAHAVVSAARGHIDVQSTVGKGTTFKVVLPGIAATGTALATPPTQLVKPAKARLLIIDDEAAVAQGVRRMLKSELEIDVLQDPRTALERLNRGDLYDAILCDLMMPGLTGMDIYRDVRKSRPEVIERFVFMTGGVFTAEAQAFLDSVPNTKLFKPFTMKDVRSALAPMVAQRVTVASEAR
ncbi:MAG: response regulator [Archangiaceae bacterium]|nr:response regulator [Archangiaceae bacterium]